jgi:hypothetical protein
MIDSSETSVLPPLLEEAVEKYKEQVGTSLIGDQLAIRLRSCDTIESINELLEQQVQEFREFRGHDRHPKLKKSIKRVVHVLHTVFTGAGNSLGGGAVRGGHGIGSVVRLSLNALMISAPLVPDAYSIVLLTCEINIFCHWYPPSRMRLSSVPKHVFS